MKENDYKSIQDNIKQYDVGKRVVDAVVTDLAHHPWRAVEFWDAIVCDPPYGIRAGAKKIGRPEGSKPIDPVNFTDTKANGDLKYPETVPYEMTEVIVDLLHFAADHLVPGGRLVYWLPTVVDEYQIQDIPRHPRMKLIVEDLSQWRNCPRNKLKTK
jgi:tRNA (guanine10-N2)-methyltransferase